MRRELNFLAAARFGVRLLQRHSFGHYGAGASYDPISSRIWDRRLISLGRDVFIGPYACISAHMPVVIGDDTVIGPGFYLMTGDHHFTAPGESHGHGTTKGRMGGVTIGRNVWIGSRVTVLRGVTIGDAAIIGAGSLVTSDIPAYTLALGAPARPRRERFDTPEARAEHERFVATLGMPGGHPAPTADGPSSADSRELGTA